MNCSILRVPYYTITYKQFDKLVAEVVCPLVRRALLKDIHVFSQSKNPLVSEAEYTAAESAVDDNKIEHQQPLAFSVFETCVSLREFYHLRSPLPLAEKKSLRLSSNEFHKWFAPAFSVWLDTVAKLVNIAHLLLLTFFTKEILTLFT